MVAEKAASNKALPPASCIRCSSGTASTNSERSERCRPQCVFCHAADGAQYVPLHFDRTHVLSYTPSLRDHCACAACWASWELQNSGQAQIQRRVVSCPVCTRHIDVRRGYAGAELCNDCLTDVLATLPPLPKQRPGPSPSRCSRRMCCWGIVAVLFFGINALAVEELMRLGLDLAADAIDKASDSGDLQRSLPPQLLELICTWTDSLEHIRFGPDLPLELLLRLGARICRSSRGPRKGMPAETSSGGPTSAVEGAKLNNDVSVPAASGGSKSFNSHAHRLEL